MPRIGCLFALVAAPVRVMCAPARTAGDEADVGASARSSEPSRDQIFATWSETQQPGGSLHDA